MLVRLAVRDLVVIPKLETGFGPGLTVITGESGAGKSVMLDALGLALGARASSDRIRPGASRAEAHAEFAIEADGETAGLLREHGILDEEEPGRCVTRRTLDREGRSRAYVNDIPVTRRTLALLGETLVDIHAQDGSMRLTQRHVQRSMLDDYGKAGGDLARTGEAWRAWREALSEIEALEEDGGNPERLALLAYQLEELDELDPQPGEYAEIEAEHRRLAGAEQCRETVAAALAALEGADPLRSAAGSLAGINDDEARLVAARDSLDTSLSLLDDAAADLRRYADRLVPDSARLEFLDARLGRLHDVARKHRVEPSTLPELRAGLTEATRQREGRSERLAELQAQRAEREAAWRKAAAALGRRRRKAAKPFAEVVGERMRALGISDGRLEVAFAGAETEHGLEGVEFHVSTHPDHPPAPLGRVASGGERARIALAIAIVAAERSALPSLVLDEADIGIGGVTADSVGRILRRLANRTQVICVTHAPQVAALGACHLRAGRDAEGTASVTVLDPEQRVEEIARMFSGSEVTDKARAHARQMVADGSRAD